MPNIPTPTNEQRVTKECPLCGSIFSGHPYSIYCSLKCQRKNYKLKRRVRDLQEQKNSDFGIDSTKPPLTPEQRQKEWDEIQSMPDFDLNNLPPGQYTITTENK